jgi:hypothetical protein
MVRDMNSQFYLCFHKCLISPDGSCCLQGEFADE